MQRWGDISAFILKVADLPLHEHRKMSISAQMIIEKDKLDNKATILHFESVPTSLPRLIKVDKKTALTCQQEQLLNKSILCNRHEAPVTKALPINNVLKRVFKTSSNSSSTSDNTSVSVARPSISPDSSLEKKGSISFAPLPEVNFKRQKANYIWG